MTTAASTQPETGLIYTRTFRFREPGQTLVGYLSDLREVQSASYGTLHFAEFTIPVDLDPDEIALGMLALSDLASLDAAVSDRVYAPDRVSVRLGAALQRRLGEGAIGQLHVVQYVGPQISASTGRTYHAYLVMHHEGVTLAQR